MKFLIRRWIAIHTHDFYDAGVVTGLEFDCVSTVDEGSIVDWDALVFEVPEFWPRIWDGISFCVTAGLIANSGKETNG